MKFFKKSVIGFLLIGLPAIVFAQEYLDNALYVVFKESASVSAKKFQRDIVPIESLNLKMSGKKMDENAFHREAYSLNLADNSLLDRTFRIQFDNSANISKIIRLLENDPNVESVERVPIFKLSSVNMPKNTPNDPYYSAVNGKEYLWYLKLINAEGAWALQQGDPKIKVAIVDGAVWGEHPDLGIPSNLQYDATTWVVGNSKPAYSDQNRQCSTLRRNSENDPDPCPVYTWSHGTHCAGVVGAKNDNGIGIASLASGVTLMGVKATNATRPGNILSGYEGIEWAYKNGAKVINCSWSGPFGGGDIGRSILKTCYDNNVTIVAAAGNENKNDRGEPAGTLYVITVGSVDESMNKSSFSNYGNWVNILAPGGYSSRENSQIGIVSTTYCKSQSLRLEKGINELNNEYYDEMSGTSMATPLVASLCALMLSKDSTLTPAQIKDILQNTSTSVNSTSFMPLAGVINAEAAIQGVINAKFDAPVEKLKVTNTNLDTVYLQWNAPSSPKHTILGYRVFMNGKILDSCTPNTTFAAFPATANMKNIFHVSVVYENGYISTREEVRASIPEIVYISTAVNPRNSGSVEGGGRHAKESMVRLTAIPNNGYKFVNWQMVGEDGILSTKPTYSVRATGNDTYVAYFASETANEDNENTSFTIVPNPAKDQVNISCPVEIKRILVCNLQGRTVMQQNNINATEWTLDVENLAEGTYIIMLQTANGSMQQKFVKL